MTTNVNKKKMILFYRFLLLEFKCASDRLIQWLNVVSISFPMHNILFQFFAGYRSY